MLAHSEMLIAAGSVAAVPFQHQRTAMLDSARAAMAIGKIDDPRFSQTVTWIRNLADLDAPVAQHRRRNTLGNGCAPLFLNVENCRAGP
jgi:hypothetical protein